MKFGFVLPMGDARTAADLAQRAELAGWDGFFAWEPVWGIDAWVSLTAAAMTTRRIHLGTMLTPLSRMRPWKLASESATLDNLSNGRVIILLSKVRHPAMTPPEQLRWCIPGCMRGQPGGLKVCGR
jgi:alkanesulfonate monooxygenase SsuD/methylene tetrahydromethanopterin reductase-like flavin-dependent oxidoreductase (luciferase family)